MHYEISVIHNGDLLFCTDTKSCCDMKQLVRVFPHLNARFPKRDGFEVMVHEVHATSRRLSDTTIMRRLRAARNGTHNGSGKSFSH